MVTFVRVIGFVILSHAFNSSALAVPSVFSVTSRSVCVKAADGFLKCAGNNKSNVLARSGATNVESDFSRADFGKVSGLEGSNGSVLKVSISSSGQTSCAIVGTSSSAQSGGVKCWGLNQYLLLNSIVPPMSVAVNAQSISAILNSGVTDLSGSEANFCAVKNNQQVYCWGALQGLTTSGFDTATGVPTLVPNITDANFPFVRKISVGYFYGCAIVTATVASSSGALRCWGDIPEIPGFQSPNIILGLSSGVSDVSLSMNQGLVVHEGIAKSFIYGGGNTQIYGPFVVTGLSSPVSQVAAGRLTERSCAIAAGGTSYCWVNGSTPPTSFVNGAVDAIAVSVNKTCVMRSGGLTCSGGNQDGEIKSAGQVWTVAPLQSISVNGSSILASIGGLSAGTWASYSVIQGRFSYLGASVSSSPVIPAEIIPGVPNDNITFLAADQYSNSNIPNINNVCLVRTFNSVSRLYCKGNPYNAGAPSGVGLPPGQYYQNFVEVPSVGDTVNPFILSVSVSYQSACAIVSSNLSSQAGTLKCWGQNDGSIPGVSLGQYVQTPQEINSGVHYKQVSVGLGTSCAIRSDNGVWCWGANLQGQVGSLASSGLSTVTNPVPVTTADGASLYGNFIVVSRVPGKNYACAVTSNGGVFCWGWTYGDTASDTNTQVTGIKKIALTGETYQLNGSSKGVVYGLNAESLYRTHLSTAIPGFETGVRDFSAMASSMGPANTHICAYFKLIPSGYKLKCQGENYNGAAGGFRDFNFSTPIQVQP